MIGQLEKFFDEKIRPGIAGHGGAVEIIDIDNDKLFLRLSGGCQGCSSSKVTLKDGIEKLVKEKFPEIKEVVDLTDHSAGTNPYYK